MRTVVATGVTRGCGLAALRQLIARDDGPFNVLVGCRRPESPSTQTTPSELLAHRRSSKTTITYLPLDLVSIESLEKFATSVKEKLGPDNKIDILLHCAGIIGDQRTLVESLNGQKVEETLFVNSIAPALLTRRLLDDLSPTARVVLVASWMHNQAPNNATPRIIEDYLSPANWARVSAYSVSKLLMLHLQQILKNDPKFTGEGRQVISLHPGFVPDSDLIRRTPSFMQFVFKRILPWFPGVSSFEQAGSVIVRAITDTELPSGCYIEPKGPSQYAPQIDKLELRALWREWFAQQGAW